MQVKCFRQETPHTCAVACLRMVLEYYGVSHDEAFLANLCETTKVGPMLDLCIRLQEKFEQQGLSVGVSTREAR